LNETSPNANLERNVAIYYTTVGLLSCMLSVPVIYAIIFHSGKTNRDYRNFVMVAQILNILHDFAYNFSFAPVLDEVFALFIRLQCACCNFCQLLYRHQLIEPAESAWRLPRWKCVLIATLFNATICTVLIPLSILAMQAERYREIVEQNIPRNGLWLRTLPSFFIIPTFSNTVNNYQKKSF
ncbi:hypothetical protein PFISCL1PPCAC_843, partial [Pristionchus fissidentatus]